MQPAPPSSFSPDGSPGKVRSLLPDISIRDHRQPYNALPKIESPSEDPMLKGRHSKWYARRKELEAELRREFNLPDDAAAVLSQLGARKANPISFGRPPPVPKPRISKSTLPPIPKPAAEEVARPRWGLTEDNPEERKLSDLRSESDEDAHAAASWWKQEQDQLEKQRQRLDASAHDEQSKAVLAKEPQEDDQHNSTSLDKTMHIRPSSWRNGGTPVGFHVGRSSKPQLEVSERTRGRAEDVPAPSPIALPRAARREDHAESCAVEAPWRSKARELEEIASAHKRQREREKQQREAMDAQAAQQEQLFAEQQAQLKEQLEQRKREIRQKEETRLEEMKREEMRRVEKEREEAEKRRQEQEEWERAIRQRFEEEAKQLKAAQQKANEEDDLLLQQKREEAQKRQEEREERRRHELEQKEQQRSRQREDAQRIRAEMASELRSNSSTPIPKPSVLPSMPAPRIPPSMPPPPSFIKRTQPAPRQSPQEPAAAGTSKRGSATRVQPTSAPPDQCTPGPGIGAAAMGSNALQAAKAAAMRDLLSLKQHPGLEARRKGFKELLRAWHPDKNPKNSEVATVVFQMLQSEQSRVLES